MGCPRNTIQNPIPAARPQDPGDRHPTNHRCGDGTPAAAAVPSCLQPWSKATTACASVPTRACWTAPCQLVLLEAKPWWLSDWISCWSESGSWLSPGTAAA